MTTRSIGVHFLASRRLQARGRLPALALALAFAPVLTPASGFAQEAPPAASPAATTPARAVDEPTAAMATLRKIIAAYRDARGVDVRVAATVGARRTAAGAAKGEGEVASADATTRQDSKAVEATFLFSSGRRALVALRGFELRMATGRIIATHASNPLTYLEVSDNGSPYYSLFNAFRSLPFPELALALGEDDPSEVCMQLVPEVPNVLPLRVEREEVEGQVSEVLVLMSDDGSEELRIGFDPETHLVDWSRATLRSGPMVEEGSELFWNVRSKSRRPKDAPTDAAFTLDVTSRQKVDGLAALVDTSEAAEEDAEVEGLKAGDPAPDLAVAKQGGGEWSLTAARAKPVVVDFWATWCGPCLASIPELARLQKDFEGRAEIVLVNSAEQGTREEREARIKGVLDPIIAKHGAVTSVLDLDGLAARRWLVRAFPTTFLVGTDGRLAWVWIGSTPTYQRELRAKLEELCAKAVEAPADAAP